VSPDLLWYKDAIFYELHVKAFQDSNQDGAGDFRGIVDRLDYLQDLGVDCIWLLPFYPSPLRDDGYDIADYYGVHPSYGTIDDFQRFMDEAHRRGLRVIADLVLNHTSDQHPWFQRARRAPKGSPEREFYVWSDTDDLYREARIIFTDTEPSNWTWDPVAGQYYWHRFFRHQPDLNWDNPEVKERMFQVMEFWLEKGLDGFRADAVPYLIERRGTICENLPETHQILKEFRTRLDRNYPDRVLLAEANQWPDDVRPYFGDGDEFHMAFHFPLMPRIFMAVRQGIRTPIVEIIERTPSIPDDCQWCMFLRNHDELTLEMVTDEERDYMYREYAKDPRMRINLGIRRRLAPLMENDRRKIELLNSILFTMPGSPIIYYGDEIGMGDNIWLGDRDGVRTPMQWSPDRNAGFSGAEPARLYLPPIQDSVYGFQAINVEAQARSPYSLLNWMKRLIQVRRQHHAFGRGSIEFLSPENSHVLAYIREHEGDVLLVVNNLSDAAQPVRLDLSQFAGRVPVELLGHTDFHPITEEPYSLTLSPYGFFWFALRPTRVSVELSPDQLAELTRQWGEQDALILASPERLSRLISELPKEWLRNQRWFRGKSREIAGVDLVDHAVVVPEHGPQVLLALVRVRYSMEESDVYLLPLALRAPVGSPPDAKPIVCIPSEIGEVDLYEALVDRHSARALVQLIAQQGAIQTGKGEVRGHLGSAMEAQLEPDLHVRRVAAEQSNTSIVFGDRYILKLFRRLEAGTNPDLEISRFLTQNTSFRDFPALSGWIDYSGSEGDAGSLAGLFEFVPNSGDAWSHTLKSIDRFFTSASRSAADPWSMPGQESLRRMGGDYFRVAGTLGDITARMHRALAEAGPEHPDFEPEPVDENVLRHWTERIQKHIGTVSDDVSRRIDAIPGSFPPAIRNDVAEVVRDVANLRSRVDDLRLLAETGTKRSRIHGDYHLGQVLRVTREGDDREWVVLDFEGEPARPLPERRAKSSALKDVAGMLRSFDYALRMTFAEQQVPDLLARTALENWASAWLEQVRKAFLDSYRQAVAGSGLVPDDPEVFARVLAVFELEKAVYELGYELDNRPDWLWVPVLGIRAIAAQGT
jgi:maltose alpha-D-glucosyltransferase / alpha-amylase